MVNGFFQGGFAQGVAQGNRNEVLQRAQTLDEQQFQANEDRQFTAEIDKNIGSTLKVISETINTAREAGAPPDKIRSIISPLVKDVGELAQGGGRDPSRLMNAIEAQLNTPVQTEPTARQKVTEKLELEKFEGEERARLGIQKKGGEFKDLNQQLQAEGRLRKEFVKQSKDFIETRDAIARVRAAGDTGAGDVSLIFGFMKLLDPGSVVREGEFATAEQTGSVPERVRNQYNNAVRGDRLTAEQRKRFKTESESLFRKQDSQQKRRVATFKKIAKSDDLRTENIILDLRSPQAILNEARSAIAAGKDPAAVQQRLIELGVDPAGL